MYDPDNSDAEITEEIANHVLDHFGYPGYEPGPFHKNLLRALCSADADHFEQLAPAFPGYAKAVYIMSYRNTGLAELRAIVQNRTKNTL